VTGLDWAALALFLMCWLFYEPLLAVVSKRSGSLNSDMKVVRQVWMRAMAGREIRLVDSQLMGHTINSASFFASANLLLIAAVAGVLFGGETALAGVAGVAAEVRSLPQLEVKLGLVLAALARGLLDFIWSIRQLNYTLALIGAAPEAGETSGDGADRRAAFAEAAGAALNPAMQAFSQGVRTYYFALAAAAWLFGPVWLGGGVLAVFALLIWRQAGSPAARAVRGARRLLD
jgi:uncharacterized membrane protein